MRLIFVLAVLFLTGCASNSYFLLKNHHFESPEAKGGNFKFSANVVPYQDVTTVQTTFNGAGPLDTIITVNNKDLADNSVEVIDHSSILFSLAILERLDVSLDFAIGNQPNYFTAKYQFIGDTQADASAGNFSLAGTLGLGYIGVSEDDPDSAFLDDFDVKGLALRAGVIVGLRSTDELLLYWSNSFSYFNTKTKYTFGVAEGDFRVRGNQWSTMLGAEFVVADHISLGLEYGYIYADTQESASEGFTSFAAKIGYNF
ncbi:MAG: hypothetical protein M9899_02490 [Bdellovibrionaceae bacterium]|nr:hypothetical protein [Pseudobdellovibrionaceae bacterium]